MSHQWSRREFTLSALATGAAAARRASAGIVGANERLKVGFIGVGNRGREVMEAFLSQPDVAITAVCDVYEPYLQAARSRVDASTATYSDYRKLLESKDVEAVVIATPITGMPFSSSMRVMRARTSTSKSRWPLR